MREKSEEKREDVHRTGYTKPGDTYARAMPRDVQKIITRGASDIPGLDVLIIPTNYKDTEREGHLIMYFRKENPKINEK